jgi:HSP20 family protein
MTTREKTPVVTREEKGRGLQRHWGQLMGPFEEMERTFERLLPRGWLRPWRLDLPGWSELTPFEIRAPRIDMVDREDEIYLRAEVPGVKKEDLDVAVTEDTVTIRGTVHHEAAEEEKGEYLHREMTYGGFSRMVALPVGVDVDHCKVVYKDGILEIRLPKVEGAKPRRIAIEEG